MAEKNDELHTWGIIKASLGRIMDEAWIQTWNSDELADALLAEGATATVETVKGIGKVAIIVIPLREIENE